MIREVETSHEPLMLTRHGKVIVKLVPVDEVPRDQYALRGKPVTVSSDFDDSMDDLEALVLESEL
jgi:antitoxin (DNA-binding transcriptional repressor) of toxin-antitoxin stability system